MTLTELKELRDRVRGLTGADREVDTHLCVTFQYMPAYDGVPLNLRRADDQGRDIGSIWLDYEADEDGRVVDYTDTAPALTGSTDAALAFSEKALPGWMVEYMGQQAHGSPGSLVGFGWCVELSDGSESRSKQGQAPALPLAIIDATLTALIETME